MRTKFAKVEWQAEDVQSLRPDWTKEKCRRFLYRAEGNLQDRTIEHGWEVIEVLLDELENEL